MAPTRQILIHSARAKAKARANKVEARAFSKATRAAGRDNRLEEERADGKDNKPEEEKEEACMVTRADRGGKGCFNCGKEGHTKAE